MKRTDNVQIEVDNFGPIVKARIDLRPLTVFVGPSNTGKSYLAILLYALHKHYGEGAFGRLVRERARSEPFPWSLPASDPFLQAAGQVKRQLAGRKGAASGGNVSVTGPALDELKRIMEGDGSLAQEIARCLGAGSAPGSLVRQGSKEARIQVGKPDGGGPGTFSHGIRITPKSARASATVPDRVSLEAGPPLRRALAELERARAQVRGGASTGWMAGFGNLVDLLFDSLVSPLGSPAYCLPADRTAIMRANRAVMGAALSGLGRGRKTASLYGVAADFLGELFSLGGRPRDAGGRKRKGSKVGGAGIEEGILGGEIEVSRSAVDCPDFAYLPREWRGRRPALPLMGASSMVSEVAPIALFLRHLVVPGSLLVIEEPESHLHPEMQVELARQLAELVSRGVRVVITTHSEWMMEELSNIVKRSEIPEGKRTGRQKGASLRQDQVGAWLFKPRKWPAGSTVMKVGFDDVGYYPTGLEDVAFTLHNDWVRLSQAAEGCRKRRGAAPQ